MLDWNCWKSNSSSTSTSDRVTAATAINVTRFIWKEVRVTCMTCRIYDFWQLNYDDIFFFLGSFVPFACFLFVLFLLRMRSIGFGLSFLQSTHPTNQPSTSSLLVHFWLGCLCYLIFFGYFLFVLLYIFIIIFFIFIYFFFFFLCFSRSLWRNTDISLNFMIWKYFISFLVASTKFFFSILAFYIIIFLMNSS